MIVVVMVVICVALAALVSVMLIATMTLTPEVFKKIFQKIHGYFSFVIYDRVSPKKPSRTFPAAGTCYPFQVRCRPHVFYAKKLLHKWMVSKSIETEPVRTLAIIPEWIESRI
jgi:hypothetical protein